MKAEDLILISVDDHVVEPPGLFEGHVPEAHRGDEPTVVHKDDGTDVWTYEGKEIPNIGLNAVAGRPPEEWGFEPTSFEEIRDGCYDIDKRIDDMNVNGVLASANFPSFPQFCGQLFSRSEDKDRGLAMVRAYNDWHIDDWAGAYPGRFIPVAIPPIWDPELMAEEVRRVADKGCHAVTFSENPAKLGWPSWHDDEHWEPFFRACVECDTAILLHIGSSSQLVRTAEDAPIDVMVALQPQNSIQAAADVLYSGVCQRHPDIKIVLSEGGIGWLPYFLERVDYVYERHRHWLGRDFGDMLPSQIIKRNFTFCFIDDKVGIENRHHIGIDNITWECDYPHSDSSWPNSPETVMKHFDEIEGITDDDINKMTHANAMRVFNFDPFEHVPREEATAGALRAQAEHVDTRTVGSGTKRERSTSLDDLVKMAGQD